MIDLDAGDSASPVQVTQGEFEGYQVVDTPGVYGIFSFNDEEVCKLLRTIHGERGKSKGKAKRSNFAFVHLEEYRKRGKDFYSSLGIRPLLFESPEEIADRVAAVLERITADRLVLAPDCGLGMLPRTTAIEKLRAIRAAADLVVA